MRSWAELEDESSDTIQREFSDGSAQHVPMRKVGDVDARPSTDPGRAVFEIPRVILEWQTQDAFLAKGRTESRAPSAAHVATRNPVMYVEERDLAGVELRIADGLVMLTGRDAGKQFEILAAHPDGQGRIAIQLQQRAKHTIVRA